MKIVALAASAGILALTFDVNTVSANSMLCSQAPVRPAKPWCLQNLEASVTDDFTFGLCLDDLQRYGRAVEEYEHCLGKDRALISRRYDEAVKEFDCFAYGEDNCESDDVVRYSF